MNIKAKFLVNNVMDQTDGNGEKIGENVNLSPVYSPDPTTENYSFSKATPGGLIHLSISNPDAFGAFTNGQEFYVDFIPVAQTFDAAMKEADALGEVTEAMRGEWMKEAA